MKRPFESPMSLHDSNVLVTGATGVVGSRLVNRLLDLKANVICFIRDHDPASALWYAGDYERVSVVNGRLENFEHVKAAIIERDIDTIFHLGAQAIVRCGHQDPHGTFETNIRGTYNILETCRLYGDAVRKIVIASSDKAYGECEALPYVEDTPLHARNPYDVSKCCADLISQSFAATYGLPIAIARCGNIFGPGDLHWSRLVPGTMRSLLRGERPVIRSDGSLIRDYLFVDDAVEAYIALGNWLEGVESKHDAQRAFNFSSNQPMSVMQMLNLIQNISGRRDLDPIVQNQAKGEISAQHLDSTRARQILRWSEQTDLKAALRSTYEWYSDYLSRFANDAIPLSPRAELTRASA